MKIARILLVTVLGLCGAGVVILFATRDYLTTSLPYLIKNDQAQMLPCGEGRVFFTKSPVELNELSAITPLGDLAPSSGHVFPTDHVYLQIKGQMDGEGEFLTKEVNVYAPGDVWIKRVARIEYWQGEELIDRDYSVYFSPCTEITGAFYHVKSLSPQLGVKIKEDDFKADRDSKMGGLRQERREAEVNIRLRAGEVIGRAGGGRRSLALDMNMWDERISPLSYANPKRWEESQRHLVCPFEYYGGAVKDKLMSLMGDGQKQRKDPPICGQVNQDIVGTAQGVWFVEETKYTFPEDRHVALVTDNIQPSQPVFSIGTSMGKSDLPVGLYKFEVRNEGRINRAFSEVKEQGHIYCYEGIKDFWGRRVNKIILLELANQNALQLEARPGLSCVGADQALSDRMMVFER